MVLEPLIRNPAYEEIFVDGPHEVGVVERTGRTVMLPDVCFDSDEEVREITKRALASVNRRVDGSSPMADARLRDGSRLNVVIPPHEAGHAVLHLRSGGHVERVSIQPVSGVWVSDVAGGARRGQDLPIGLQLQVRMAGEAATCLQGGRSTGLRASGDRDVAGALALEAADGDRVEAALLVDAAWRAAREALEDSRT
jgi:hypothetical protein